MTCASCGAVLDSGGACLICTVAPKPKPSRTSGFAIAGFVCAWCCLGPIALVFSLIAIAQIEKSRGRLSGQGLASAGLIISICSIVFQIAVYACVQDCNERSRNSMQGCSWCDNSEGYMH